jgi:ubiquinone/menaquinone biosynthesis C-methylase UbiE
MATTSVNEEKLHETTLALMAHLNGVSAAVGIQYGMELGLFDALSQGGPATSGELADRTGLNERWVREWLYQQAAARVVEHEDARRFSITPESALLLADESTPATMIPMFSALRVLIDAFEHLPEAMCTGLGRPHDGHGADWAAVVERISAVWIPTMIASALPALDGVTAKLEAGGRAADIGCGSGARTLAMARAFPNASWAGYDSSEHALARSRAKLSEAADVTNLRFHNSLDEPVPSDGSLDLVSFCDVLHDATHPQHLLEVARNAVKPDGTVLVIDIAQPPAQTDKLQHPGATLSYGFSLAFCMSSSAATEDGAALGTLGLDAPKLHELAAAAGFTRFRQTKIDDPLHAYYELRP